MRLLSATARARNRGRACASALVALTALAGAPARAFAKDPDNVTATDKETARRLLDEGDELAARGEHQAALEKYIQADALVAVPTTALPLGHAYEALGKLVEARDAYLRAARFPTDEPNQAFDEAKREASERAAALSARIATVSLVVSGAERVALSLDGVAVSAGNVRELSVNPGHHTIAATAPGFRPATADVTVSESAHARVSLVLEPDPDAPLPPDAPSAGRFPGWATAGFTFAAAGLAVGIGTGVASLGKSDTLADACSSNKVCPPGQGLEGVQSDALALANASNVAFGLAGAGALFGIVALFTLDDVTRAPEATSAVAPFVGPGSLGLRGRF